MPRFRLTFLDNLPAAVSLLARKARWEECERDLSWDGMHKDISMLLLPLASCAARKLPRLVVLSTSLAALVSAPPS